MLSCIKQVFIGFLSCSESLATKCLFLNDEPCMVRPTLIDMNPVEFKYYPFMIRLNKCTGSCNVSSSKICVPKETKSINVKVFNMITKMKLKQWENVNSIIQYVIRNKSWLIKHVNKNVKIIVSVKKIIVGIPAHAFVRIESIADTCDWVWWNCNCYEYCINKKEKYYCNKKDKYNSNKCYEYYFNKLS